MKFFRVHSLRIQPFFKRYHQKNHPTSKGIDSVNEHMKVKMSQRDFYLVLPPVPHDNTTFPNLIK